MFDRCSRNCFDCPICSSPLGINGLDQAAPQHVPESTTQLDVGPKGPFFLACAYCEWSSLDTGIQLEKPTGISEQLARIKNGGESVPSLKEVERGREKKKALELGEDREPTTPDRYARDNNPNSVLESQHLFSNLAAFYKSQLAYESPAATLLSPGYGFNSPSTLARIMNMYNMSGSGPYGFRRPQPKPRKMPEACGFDEGSRVYDPLSESDVMDRMCRLEWAAHSSITQRLRQPHPIEARYINNLRPQPTLLRSKRTKRCRACRHILVKPDSKVTSTRVKIRLLAMNYIPGMTLRALPSAGNSSTSGQHNRTLDVHALQPQEPVSILVRMTNPLFDKIHVTLATPSVTPGRVGSRVTLLCSQFGIGANTDVWDEALKTGESKEPSRAARPGITVNAGAEDKERLPEAGKVWEEGRNWVSIVLEVVPGSLPHSSPGVTDGDELQEDEDVLEIPIWVSIEYETDVQVDPAEQKSDRSNEKGVRGGEAKERREMAYWSVLGVGKIADSSAKT